jgi:hypothetical protein
MVILYFIIYPFWSTRYTLFSLAPLLLIVICVAGPISGEDAVRLR